MWRELAFERLLRLFSTIYDENAASEVRFGCLDAAKIEVKC